MISKFVFSEEGTNFLQEFCDRFDVDFRFNEPSDDLVFDDADSTYKVPEWETIEGLKEAVAKSLEVGENQLKERYKDYIVIYEENVFY